MAWPVDLDDHGASVAEYDEVRSSYAGVAEFGPGQWQHCDRAMGRELSLDFDENLVNGKFGAAGEYKPVLGWEIFSGALSPGTVATVEPRVT